MHYKLIILLFVSLKMSGQPLVTTGSIRIGGGLVTTTTIGERESDTIVSGCAIRPLSTLLPEIERLLNEIDATPMRDTTAAYILISDRTNKDYSNLIAINGYIVTIGERKIYLDYKKRQLPQRYIVWQTIKQ